MKHNFERAGVMLQFLKSYIDGDSYALSDFSYKKTDYKVGSDLPNVDETWGTFSADDIFSGYDEHAWFYKKVVIPAHLKNKNIYLHFSTNVYGWDAVNPQFIVYINGKIVQALDVNHTMVKLDSSLDEFDLYLYAYTGSVDPDWFTGQRVNPQFMGTTIFLASLIVIMNLVSDLLYKAVDPRIEFD